MYRSEFFKVGIWQSEIELAALQVVIINLKQVLRMS